MPSGENFVGGSTESIYRPGGLSQAQPQCGQKKNIIPETDALTNSTSPAEKQTGQSPAEKSIGSFTWLSQKQDFTKRACCVAEAGRRREDDESSSLSDPGRLRDASGLSKRAIGNEEFLAFLLRAVTRTPSPAPADRRDLSP